MSPSAPRPADAPPSQPWMALALVFAAFVGGAGTLWSGWLGDDIALVRDNAAINGPRGLSKALAGQEHPGPSEPGAYRPVTLATFALTAAVAEDGPRRRSPFVDHVFNVLLHVLATWLLYRTFLQFAPGRGQPVFAFAAAFVFAVHPVHVQALAPLSGRAESLALLFSCACALAWFAARRGNTALLPITSLCWLLALGSHEVALAVPLVLALAPAATGARARWLPLLAFVPALVVYLVIGGGPSGNALLGPGDRFLAGMAAFGHGVIQWIVPIGLPTVRVDAWSAPSDGARVVAFLVLAVTLFSFLRVALGRGGWVARAWCGAFLLFVVPLVVYLGAAPIGFSLAYVVTAPLALWAGAAARSLWGRSRSPLPLGLAGLATVGALAFLSVSETEHWRDDETRFSRRMALNAQDFAGQEAFSRFLRKEARAEELRAIGLRSDDPERGRALRRREALLARATEWSLRATQGAGRQRAAAWRERGLVLAARHRWANALPLLEHAAKLDPRLTDPDRMESEVARGNMEDAAELFYAIGSAHEALGRRDEAAEPFRFASLLDPDNAQYLRRAGQALTRIGRYREGLPMLERAYERAEDPEVRSAIAKTLESERRAVTRMSSRYLQEGREAQDQGKYRNAVRAYERALEVNDELVEAHIRVGFLRGWHFGNYALGYEHLDKAERILRKRGADDPLMKEVEKYRRLLKKYESEEDEEEN